MSKDQQYKQEYVAFTSDVLNNYAEEVPQEELTDNRKGLVHTTPWDVPPRKAKTLSRF